MEKDQKSITQYDSIAEGYSSTVGMVKEFLSMPTFFKVLGNIKDKKILDLACGDGYLTRKISEIGANVIGCDISSKMVQIGKEIEEREKRGIEYFVADVCELDRVGDFDIITAGYLLHYSQDKEALRKMCANIFKNLKPGGRFVAINQNPSHPTTPNKKFGAIIEAKEPVNEGDELTMTFFNKAGEKAFAFSFFHWNRDTYEASLREAGFENIEWHDLEVSDEGKDKYGEEFWKDFYKYPSSIILEARK